MIASVSGHCLSFYFHDVSIPPVYEVYRGI